MVGATVVATAVGGTVVATAVAFTTGAAGVAFTTGATGAAVAAATVPQSPMVSVPSSVLNDSEIRRRVTLYMDRCKTLGVTPTLKQIQSAIKRGKKSTGLSYNEISNVVTSLGYKV